MPTHPLFVYGTLREEMVQRNVIGRIVPMQPATLHGYCRKEVNLGGIIYYRLERIPGCEVCGSVIKVTDTELQRLDGYEGEAYARVSTKLTDGSKAFVYVKPEGVHHE